MTALAWIGTAAFTCSGLWLFAKAFAIRDNNETRLKWLAVAVLLFAIAMAVSP